MHGAEIIVSVRNDDDDVYFQTSSTFTEAALHLQMQPH